MEPLDLKALKRVYKEAKREAEDDPSDEELGAAYRLAKQRYKAASAPPPPPSAAAAVAAAAATARVAPLAANTRGGGASDQANVSVTASPEADELGSRQFSAPGEAATSASSPSARVSALPEPYSGEDRGPARGEYAGYLMQRQMLLHSRMELEKGNAASGRAARRSPTSAHPLVATPSRGHVGRFPQPSSPGGSRWGQSTGPTDASMYSMRPSPASRRRSPRALPPSRSHQTAGGLALEPQPSNRLATPVSSPSRDMRTDPASSCRPSPAQTTRLSEGVPSPSRELHGRSLGAAIASPVSREDVSQYFEVVARQTVEELTRRQRAQGTQITGGEPLQLQQAWSKVLEQSESVTRKLQEEQDNVARYEAMTEQLRQVAKDAEVRRAELQQELQLSEESRKAAETRERDEREAMQKAQRRAEETARMLADVQAKLLAVGGAAVSSSPEAHRPASASVEAASAGRVWTHRGSEPEPEPEQLPEPAGAVSRLEQQAHQSVPSPRDSPQASGPPTPREKADALALEVKRLAVVQVAQEAVGKSNSPRASATLDVTRHFGGDEQATEMLTQATSILQTREMEEKNKRHDIVKAFYEKQQDLYLLVVAPGQETFDVTFTEQGSLGLSLHEDPTAPTRAIVESVIPGAQASRHPELEKGLVLSAIGGHSIGGVPYTAVVTMLRGTGRPVTLSFTRLAATPPLQPNSQPLAPQFESPSDATVEVRKLLPLQEPVVVEFDRPDKLGMLWVPIRDENNRDCAMVKAVSPSSQAAEKPVIRRGLILATVHAGGIGGSVLGLKYDQILDRMRSQDRPLVISFDRHVQPGTLHERAEMESGDEAVFLPPAISTPKRQEIDALYAQYNPDKLGEVDGLVAKYGEEKLATMIKKKYGVGQPSLPEQIASLPQPANSPSAIRQEIEALYQQHNPQKVAEVDDLIGKYGEVKLLKLVRKKYRVEQPQQGTEQQVQTAIEPIRVTFSRPGPLGFRFAPDETTGTVYIMNINEGSQAMEFPELRKGMILHSIGATPLAGMQYDEVIELIRKHGRPLDLTFKVPQAEKASSPPLTPNPNASAPTPADPTGPASTATLQQEMAEVHAEETAEAARKREQREAIETLYRQFNPAKLGDIDGLLAKYGEVALLRMVRKKYSVAAREREEIEAIYKSFESSKLVDIPQLVSEHGETELLRMVKQKYQAHLDVQEFLTSKGELKSTSRVIKALVDANPSSEWLANLKAMENDGSWTDFLDACNAFAGDSDEEGDQPGSSPAPALTPEPTGQAIAMQQETMKTTPAAPPVEQLSEAEKMAAALAEVEAEEEEARVMSTGLETVTFTAPGSLGIRFAPNPQTGAVEILAIVPGGQASQFAQMQVGMMLTAVGNQSIAGMQYADVIEMIKKQGRPLTMVFAAGAGGGSGVAPAPAAVPAPEPPAQQNEEAPPQINAAGSAVQQTVVALYSRYNPEKVPEVPNLITKYGEDDLLRMVRKKYAKQEKKRQQEIVGLQKWLADKQITVNLQQVVAAFDNAKFAPAEWIPTLENMPTEEMEEFIIALTAQ